MDRMEKLRYLNQLLLDEMPEYRPRQRSFPWKSPPSGGCSGA